MFDFLCWVFTLLLGGWIGWFLAGWLSQREYEASGGSKIVEKTVDNPEHLALINELQAENKEIEILKTKLSEASKDADNSVERKKISDLEAQVKDLESSQKSSETKTIDNPEHLKKIEALEAEIASYKKADSENKPTGDVLVETQTPSTKESSSVEEKPLIEEDKTTTAPAPEVSTVDKTKAKASGFRIKKLNGKDDFTVVLGIGPKISGLIHTTDIHTFKELSETSVEDIQKILDEAGPKYKLAVPKTWPAQAELAAKNKWEELKAWQNELDGGK